MVKPPLTDFINTHYHHFNAQALKQAAQGYIDHHHAGKRMMITLAGAMSTAELGRSLAPMIRAGLVDAICCTGANLEEDLFRAVAHSHYQSIPDYRELRAADEKALHDAGFNRVTDTCIPEVEAMRCIEAPLIAAWKSASINHDRRLPHDYVYTLVQQLAANGSFQVPLDTSWVLAAAEHQLPLYVPGWEDSTLGNFCVAASRRGDCSLDCVLSGLHYMDHLIDWYTRTTAHTSVGFFQVGGGISGDFPICAVPLINQDLQESVPLWSYFCQITDATESYGGYSGAHPNEKITWGKLDASTPRFVIHSDASIVAPLLFQAVLENT
ncbi:MAG: deoxyhypusine synthase family protein [Candidatus Marinamargulisbacteria bacterium]|nr:deoxyhypusine synthase [bacterium]MDG2264633.1 deoxyhypusine synthase family protein [Candidatus Marinamargulisbacteria bacterium]|tara:strand:+ start:1461 stop:2435 length:975 start_codon:yes stop_codon:yes gene_type:complete